MSSIMALFITVSGTLKVKEKVKEFKFGKTELNMKEIGNLIRQMVMVD